jgi:quercetin dioxygenase-like cupin family protein
MTATEPKKIEPSILTIKPNSSTEIEDSHEGFEFGYIIKGKIEIFLDENKYKANEGECFFFKSNKKHFIKNNQKNNISEIIWIEIY